MNTARTVAIALIGLVASAAPALAEEGPITHTDQLIVVTPNAPVVINNGPGTQAPGSVAQPAGPATTTNGAPQNEPWSEVSHINGTLVKVGEKSDYVLRYRKTNISTNPIGWMFGIYGVSVSHAVSQHVAIRGDANIVNFEGAEGYEIGASLPIYFRRVYSGPFIEPGFIMRGSKSSWCDSSYDDCGTETMAGPEMLFGWHWSFDSGLNVAFALGAARNLNQEMDESGYSSSEDVTPAGYFRIGYAF
ncbi:MAG: hypothetical protein H0T42_15110 [Deltaproteobacteria bacterium]|nr:hypothetical protein [Deltaproteobacteria bacterium]